MNELKLKQLFGEVLHEASTASSVATVERCFEQHLPAMLQARDPAADILLPNSAIETMVKRVLASSTDPKLGRRGIAPNWDRRNISLGWTLAAGVAAALIVGSAIWLSTPPEVDRLIASPRGTPSLGAPGPVGPKSPDQVPGGYLAEDPPGSSTRGGNEQHPNGGSEVVLVSAHAGKLGPVLGEPLVREPNGSERLAVEGGHVSMGSRIETGEADQVLIDMVDGSTITLGYGTIIIVSPKGFPRSIELLKGSVLAKVAKTSDSRKFTITTTAAVAEVFGTEFSLALIKSTRKKGDTAVLKVKSGVVALSNSAGKKVARAMMQTSATIGEAPEEPKRLDFFNEKLFMNDEGHFHLMQENPRLDEATVLRQLDYPIGWSGLILEQRDNWDVTVRGIYSNSPAARAGMQLGDILLSCDGYPVDDPASLLRIFAHSPGRNVNLQIRRNGTQKTFELTLLSGGKRDARLTRDLADSMLEATWPAFSGNPEVSSAELNKIAVRHRHPAVFNNLAVVYELMDKPGPAIRNYRSAVSLAPENMTYRARLGSALKKVGNMEAAIEEFAVVASHNPNSIHSIRELAHTLTLAGRFDEAHAVLDAAIERLPKEVNLWIYKGSTYLDSGRLAEARETYIQATQLDRQNYFVWYQLGYVNNLLQLYDDAVLAFERVAEIAPNAGDSFEALGGALHSARRLDDAYSAYMKALDINPRSPEAHGGLAWLYESYGEKEKAETHYRQAIELAPNDIKHMHNLGILLAGYKPREAEELFHKVIAMDPKHASTYRAYGDLLRDSNRNREAESNYKQAIELDPRDPYSHESLGHFYRHLGKYADAAAAYETAVAIEPRNSYRLNLLGWTYMENRQWVNAVRTLRKSLSVATNGDDVLQTQNNLANALMRMGEFAEAGRLIGEALASDPNDLQTMSSRAFYLAHQGILLDEALVLAKKAAEPTNVYALRYEVLGFVHYKRGEYADAVRWSERAANGYGKAKLASDALVTMGLAHEALKDVSSAILAYRRALAVEPENRVAAERLHRLRGGDRLQAPLNASKG